MTIVFQLFAGEGYVTTWHPPVFTWIWTGTPGKPPESFPDEACESLMVSVLLALMLPCQVSSPCRGPCKTGDGYRVIQAVADFAGSALLVALTSTRAPPAGTFAGAMYSPKGMICPGPTADHVTERLLAPVTVAER